MGWTIQALLAFLNDLMSALSNPVDIYVERVNAKVNAKIDKNYKRTGETENAWSQNAEGKYQIKVGSIDVTTYEENTNSTPTTHEYPVYAVVQGWQVADANGKAEVCKQIKTSWFAGELGINPWTTSDYHRSFWSESVPFNSGAVTGANRPVNHSFNAINMPLSDVFAATPVYTLPNTPDAVVKNPKTSDNDLTKLIVAAKLVYKDADDSYKTAQVCQYRGLTYLGEDAVKKQIVGGFKQYLKNTATGGYQSIEASDITFKTVPGSSVVKDYEVVATLASNVGELYVKDGETYKTVSKDDVYDHELAKLKGEDRRLLEETYKGFVRDGALLSKDKKARVEQINKRISDLQQQWGTLLQEATNNAVVWVNSKEELAGLSEADIAQCQKDAQSRGGKAPYAIVIINTTQQPILTNLDNRDLRRRVYEASIHRSDGTGKYNTLPIVVEMAKLRAEKGEIMGYKNYAAYSLEKTMAKNSVRIRLKAYENRSLDAASEKIVKTATSHGAKKIVGPVPLPTEREVITVLRAVHKYKDSREQFEIRTHKRLIEIVGPSAETIDALSRLDLPSGVDIEIKL